MLHRATLPLRPLRPLVPRTANVAFSAAAADGSIGIVQTPYVQSTFLTQRVGAPVHLKLDTLQRSGSFKDRGMWHLCKTLKADGISSVISSSGGNAGLAVACMGQSLGLSVQVVVPTTTKAIMLDKIQSYGASVTVHGDNWNQADQLVQQKLAEADGGLAYAHPYDNPLLWEGHSTMIDEIAATGHKPDAVVCAVGGGGMLMGIYLGLARHGWQDVKVITVETEGAASFARAFRSRETVRLDCIDTIATSLGALQVSDACLDWAWNKHTNTEALVVSDAEAVQACVGFAHDHRALVEPACGAALCAVYGERFREQMQMHQNGVAVIVCGGSGVDVDIMAGWAKEFL